MTSRAMAQVKKSSTLCHTHFLSWCRSLFSSVSAARQHMREAYEMDGSLLGGWGGERERRREGLTDGLM